jgi:prepilin-type N-terminal cleavage/methylation domain-containing protein
MTPDLRTSTNAPPAGRRGRAFTLIEVLTSILVVSILISLSALSFRRITQGNILAQSQNTVLAAAKIARSYAITHHIETMLVINPFNGRMELWHLNPPPDGGTWTPLSDGTAYQPADGYRFAPVFDASARLPTDASARPLAAVHPVDYDDPTYRPTALDPAERNIDNLTWSALCFDANGRLVIRTRRIATRTYHLRNGGERPAAQRNRLADESPDLTRIPLVDQTDTLITSTRGLVISDLTRLEASVPQYYIDPSRLVSDWLMETRPGNSFSGFANTLLLNRLTGEELPGSTGHGALGGAL